MYNINKFFIKIYSIKIDYRNQNQMNLIQKLFQVLFHQNHYWFLD